MSYRFIWKKIASKALSSTVARGLLAINSHDLWDKIASTESLSPEQVARLRTEIDETLKRVEASGRQERDLVGQVLKELVGQIVKGGRGP